MTRREYREAFRLTDREKAEVWNEVRAPRARRHHGRRWLPAAGGLAAAACLVAAVLITGGEDGRGPGTATTDVAVRSSEQAPAPAPPAARRPAPEAGAVPAPATEAVRELAPRSLPAADKAAGTLSEGLASMAPEADSDRTRTGAGAAEDLREEAVAALRQPMAATPAPPTVGAESGGRRNPNDRPYDLVYHRHTGVNPFVATEEDALSTFAVEVDDASWTVARRYLTDGHLPPPEAIRLEEMVNRLDPGLPQVGAADFSLHADGAPSRFGAGYHLLRLGVRARDVAAAERAPAHLVFVIDISGSMDRENRLGLVKRALRVLVDELQPRDRVGIVAYGGTARVVLAPTDAGDRQAILAAIDALQPDGATAAEAGLRLAYGLARDHAEAGTSRRLILCSDGVANVGNTAAESILAAVREHADQGTSLTTVGFGMGNYNDVLMEQLANQGDGTYHYVDRLADAERVFRENLTGTLQTLGAEVRTQVEFDPASVERWRLLGYENRDLADEDFRDDTVDAGEIGAGHAAVALYEIKLTEAAADALARGKARELGTFRLRWARPHQAPDAGEVAEVARPLTTADLAPSWDAAAPRLRAAAIAAEFAEILRGSYWARGNEISALTGPVTRVVSELPGDGDVLELSQLIHRAAGIAGER